MTQWTQEWLSISCTLWSMENIWHPSLGCVQWWLKLIYQSISCSFVHSMGAKEEMQHLFCHIHAPEGIPDNDKKIFQLPQKNWEGLRDRTPWTSEAMSECLFGELTIGFMLSPCTSFCTFQSGCNLAEGRKISCYARQGWNVFSFSVITTEIGSLREKLHCFERRKDWTWSRPLHRNCFWSQLAIVSNTSPLSKQPPQSFELPPALRKSESDFKCCGLLSPWRSNIWKRGASIAKML